jgi:hypothetical protein
MSELLWQHWIIKPLCLIVVAFPLTIAAGWLGRWCLRHAPVVTIPLAGLAASVPFGALYLVATALFN